MATHRVWTGGTYGSHGNGSGSGSGSNDDFAHSFLASNPHHVHQINSRGVLNTRSFDGKEAIEIHAPLGDKKSHRRTQSFQPSVLYNHRRISIGPNSGSSNFGFSQGHRSNQFDPFCATSTVNLNHPTIATPVTAGMTTEAASNVHQHAHVRSQQTPFRYPTLDPVQNDVYYVQPQVVSPSNLAITPGSSTIASNTLPPDPMAGKWVVFEFPPDLDRTMQTVPQSIPMKTQAMCQPTPAPTQKAQRRASVYAPIPMAAMDAASVRTPLRVLSPNQQGITSNEYIFDDDSVMQRVPGATTSEFVHPDKRRLKQQRKRRTAGGAVSGAVIGGVAMGPIGAVIGGAAAGIITKQVCKASEKRAQRKYESVQTRRNDKVHSGTFA